jgi:adenylate cyclase
MRLGSTALATERVERRLAAILAADVAGYSRLMGADEEETLARLKAHRRELIDPKIEEHRGRIVKTTGDGLLLEFASVVDAVRCAVEIQRSMIDYNAGTAEDKRINFRIGVNLGDVIVEGDDLYGDGVNIAARLEGLAEPGGIRISRTVRDHVRDKLPYSFEDIGEQRVKNIARPVRAYAMSPAAMASLPAVAVPIKPVISNSEVGEPVIRATPRLSIVVLPFANLSNDPEQEYFADGITDDLTTDLSRITDSFVIARNTAFAYKGKPIDVKQVGQELGVRYVLEGSVRRTGDQVRVNVQLINVETGAHVWADRFETDRASLLEAQDEITGRLARMLNLELVRDASHRIEQEKAVHPEARDFVMRGWAALSKPTSLSTWPEAQRLFERALEIDARSLDAKVGIARALGSNVADGWSNSVRQDLARAEQFLLEALEADANSAQAHEEIGRIRRLQNRLLESKIELETAIALDRNSVFALRQLGQTLMWLGHPEAGIPHIERAIRLSPRDPSLASIYWALGACHLLSEHADQAVDLLRRARAANPRFWRIHFWLAAALGVTGELEEAKAALAQSIELKPEINSLAQLRINSPSGNAQYRALREKTVAAGLRRAGFPDE